MLKMLNTNITMIDTKLNSFSNSKTVIDKCYTTDICIILTFYLMWTAYYHISLIYLRYYVYIIMLIITLILSIFYKFY